jgi:hypothetical protein
MEQIRPKSPIPIYAQKQQFRAAQALPGFALLGEASWPFYPMLILAFLSIVGFVCYERTWGKSPLGIFGYVTGIFLSSWFHFVHVSQLNSVVAIVLYHAVVSLFFFGIFFLALFHSHLHKHFPQIGKFYAAVALVICLSVLLVSTGSNSSEPVRLLIMSPFLFVAVSLLISPCLMLLSCSTTLVYVLRKYPTQRRFGLRSLMLTWVPWFAAYFAAIRYSIQKSIEIYSTLPTEPPNNCFIVSASMRGHPRWVKSESVRTPFGSVQINLQLRRFKALELAMKARLPAVHRASRGSLQQDRAVGCDENENSLAMRPCLWIAQAAGVVRCGGSVCFAWGWRKSIEKLYEDTSQQRQEVNERTTTNGQAPHV